MRSNDTAIIPGDKQTECHKPPQTQQGLLCLTLWACVLSAFGSPGSLLGYCCVQCVALCVLRDPAKLLHRSGLDCGANDSTAGPAPQFLPPLISSSRFFFFFFGGVFKHNLKRTLYCKLNQLCEEKKEQLFVDCTFVFTLDPRDSSCCNKTFDNGAKVTEFLCKMFLVAAACLLSLLF